MSAPWEAAALCLMGSSATCVLLNVPRRHVLACGAIGTFAFFTALGLGSLGLTPIATSFLASFLTGVVAEVAARVVGSPVALFSVPGVIPLVPGVMAYRAMFALVEERHDLGSSIAVGAVLIAASLAAGLVLAGSLFHLGDRHLDQG